MMLMMVTAAAMMLMMVTAAAMMWQVGLDAGAAAAALTDFPMLLTYDSPPSSPRSVRARPGGASKRPQRAPQ